jgi:hypothetical protein
VLIDVVGSCTSKGVQPPGWTEVNEKVESVFSPTTRELGGGKIV